MAEVEDILKGTTLEGAPMVAGLSHDRRRHPGPAEYTWTSLLEATETRRDSGRPRLSIDRAFTMPGFGTVVTGTLNRRLPVRRPWRWRYCPRASVSRIRGLQSHRQKVDTATPPDRRLAVNLSGVSHDDIERGEVLTIPRAGSGLP